MLLHRKLKEKQRTGRKYKRINTQALKVTSTIVLEAHTLEKWVNDFEHEFQRKNFVLML